MSATILRSSAIATAFGIALLGGVLSGSTMTIPDEAARKGGLRTIATDCGECAGGDRLTHFVTSVEVDRDAGLVTLVRERIGN